MLATRRSFLLAGLALALTSCDDEMSRSMFGTRYPPYRYKITVFIDTGQGVRSGSSVFEFHDAVGGDAALAGRGALSSQVTGEAIKVQLQDGRYVYCLLPSVSRNNWLRLILTVPKEDIPDNRQHAYSDADMTNAVEKALRSSRGVRDITPAPKDPAYWPLTVTFEDEKNPESVRILNFDDEPRRLVGFGKLVRITAELTDDPVTTTLPLRFSKWWLARKNRSLAGGPQGMLTAGATDAQNLS